MKIFLALLILLSAPITQSIAASLSLDLASGPADWQKGFPATWWQEIPRKEAKSWEVLPQDAGLKEVILSKRTELGVFSNFADASFVFHGVCYPTVEAFWQMMKYPETPDDIRWSWTPQWKWTRAQVASMNGFSAKSAGNYANFFIQQNKANWLTFEGKKITFASVTPGEHYALIWQALSEKIRQNPQVLQLLLQTKDLKLIPDHDEGANAPPEWHYNVLWMEIRSLIQNNKFELKSSEDRGLKTCRGADIKNL